MERREIMAEKKIKSTLPIYAAGITFVAFAVIFSIYTITGLAMATFCALVIFFVVSSFAPSKTIFVEMPPEPAKTSDIQLNQLIDDGRKKLTEIDKLSRSIDNARVREDVRQIKHYSENIFTQLEKHPEKISSVRQFMDYYLPTSYNLIENYVSFKKQGVTGENAMRATQKIEEALDKAADAFKKQYDNMFEAKAMDIIAEANVMERLLKSSGLTGDDFDTPSKEGGSNE